MNTIHIEHAVINQPIRFCVGHPLRPDVEVMYCDVHGGIWIDSDGPPQPGRILFPPSRALIVGCHMRPASSDPEFIRPKLDTTYLNNSWQVNMTGREAGAALRETTEKETQ